MPVTLEFAEPPLYHNNHDEDMFVITMYRNCRRIVQHRTIYPKASSSSPTSFMLASQLLSKPKAKKRNRDERDEISAIAQQLTNVTFINSNGKPMILSANTGNNSHC